MHENWLARQGVHEMRPAYSLNLTMRAWGHQFLYDIEVFKDLAKITGGEFKPSMQHYHSVYLLAFDNPKFYAAVD